jgi:hypothetical protein
MAIKEQDWECTCFFNGWWNRCCVAHDIYCADANAPKALASGEWIAIREKGDKQLKVCVSKSGPLWLRPVSRKIGSLMYIGVSNYTKYLIHKRNRDVRHQRLSHAAGSPTGRDK